jgi:hypothetical protein
MPFFRAGLSCAGSSHRLQRLEYRAGKSCWELSKVESGHVYA